MMLRWQIKNFREFGRCRIPGLMLAPGVQQDAKHAAQRLGGPPEELVPNSEGGQIILAHRQSSQTPDRHRKLSRNRRRRELGERLLAAVRHHLYPVMRLRQHPFNLVERERAPQFDGEGLAVTTHRAYPDAYPVHRNLLSIPAKNLVRFRLPLPFFAAPAITDVFV